MCKPKTAKGEQRRAAFLEVATRLFLKEGFAAVSVNRIVKEAGGSLATLYSYFPTKKDIFTAIAKQDASNRLMGSLDAQWDDRSVEETLTLAARELVARIGTPELINLFRLTLSAASKSPDEVRAFAEERRFSVIDQFTQYLSRQCVRGTLHIDDVEFAANQLLALLRGTWALETLCGLEEFFEAAYLEKVVTQGVATFLARYGPEKTV